MTNHQAPKTIHKTVVQETSENNTNEIYHSSTANSNGHRDSTDVNPLEFLIKSQASFETTNLFEHDQSQI